MRTKPLIFLLASLSSLNTHKVQNLQNISVGISHTQIFLISLYVWFLNHFSVSISLSNTAPTLDSLLPSSSSQSTPTSFSLSLSLSLARSFGVVFNAKQTLDNLSNLSQRILLFHNVHCLSL